MVLETILGSASPFAVGIALLIGVVSGMFILGLPLEAVVLIAVPFSIVVVGYYIGAMIPVIAIMCGLVIGLMFLRLVRR